jgi:ribonuclease HI
MGLLRVIHWKTLSFLYTDGSNIVKGGVRKAGWAVSTMDNVIVTGTLPAGTSAQVAELMTLTEACKRAEGSYLQYTGSRYAIDFTHDFGKIWTNRGFMTSLGAPVNMVPEVRALLNALQLPGQVAIFKMKTHEKLLFCVVSNALLSYLVTQIHSLGHIGVDNIVCSFVGKLWNAGVRK